MIRKAFQIIITLFCLATGTGQVLSQVTEARVEIDTSAIMLGDQIRMTLSLDVPAGSEVFWPYFTGDTVVTGIEIISQEEVDTTSIDGGYLRVMQEFTITSFDSGYYTIPPIPFKFIPRGDTAEYLLQSLPVQLQVDSPDVDLASDIKPIKPPLEAPFTLDEALPYLGGLVLLAAIALGIIYYLKKRKKAEPIFTSRWKPSVPAHVQALDNLEALKMKKLWQSGRIKEYHSELTEIVRWYIEERFRVAALEMTTGEIMSGLKRTDAPKEAAAKLEETLVLADLVKFAKEKPLPEENEKSLVNCIHFVKETIPVERPEPGEEKREIEKVST